MKPHTQVTFIFAFSKNLSVCSRIVIGITAIHQLDDVPKSIRRHQKAPQFRKAIPIILVKVIHFVFDTIAGTFRVS